jgi:hypothetical protein
VARPSRSGRVRAFDLLVIAPPKARCPIRRPDRRVA